MNCECFQDQLFEYLDGTLSAEALAAAQKHLAHCDRCRQAVEKEKHLASDLSCRFRQSVQSLTLHLEIRRNILATSPSKGSAPMVTGPLIYLCKNWFRVMIPSATLLVAGVFLAVHFFGTRNRETVSTPIQPRLATVASPVRGHPETSVSVEISYRLPVHEFHREGNLVVDALVNETVVAEETIPSGSVRNLP